MREFAGTAAYYSRYRPGIPPEVADLLIREANRDAPARTLLDLGTGTGQVIEALHHAFESIIAVEPDPEMLQCAREQLRAIVHAGAQLSFFQGKAEDFAPPDGWMSSLVTISRAFHWMDQAGVLARLAGYVPATGVVAVFGDRSFWEADSPWIEVVRRVVRDFLGENRRAGTGHFSHHNRPYSEIMRESPFCVVEEIRIPVRRVWNADSIIGYLFSTSFAALPLFGDRVSEFESAVRAALRAYSDDDTFVEENEFTVRLGRKDRD